MASSPFSLFTLTSQIDCPLFLITPFLVYSSSSLCFSSCAPSFSLLFSQLHYLSSSSSSLAAAALSVWVLQERKRFSSENCTGSWRITGVSGDWKPLSLNYILLIGELGKLNGKGIFFVIFLMILMVYFGSEGLVYCSELYWLGEKTTEERGILLLCVGYGKLENFVRLFCWVMVVRKIQRKLCYHLEFWKGSAKENFGCSRRRSCMVGGLVVSAAMAVQVDIHYFV